ncbi:Uncharacterized protein OBRU01_23022 [Operophtera brumata]|uniref:Uncharacterized protein n=1 Tax=Operophtera brumata TaxID=104452 RepID=A0A0L7KPM5_OPEBR|nr:Uncharacterized protein OBRU01_23022 [Operophtera brumata]
MSQLSLEVMANSVKKLEVMFTQQMDEFKGRIDKTASPSRATTCSLATEFSTFKDFIIGALQILQNQLQVISSEVDNIEMRSRRKILLLHGVPEANNEIISEVIVQTVVQKLKLDHFNKSAISRCHRMGRAATTDKPRPILFKLLDTEVRNKVWFAKTDLKGTGITMSEFLTKSRHDTFMAARQRFGISKCWTKDGCVFVLAPDGLRHHISSQQDLDKMLQMSAKKAPVRVVEPVVASRSRRALATAAAKK